VLFCVIKLRENVTVIFNTIFVYIPVSLFGHLMLLPFSNASVLDFSTHIVT
jgi:hypothetical protein